MTIRRACRSRIWSSGGPVSAASRGWRCCARAFPMCGCRICRIRRGRRWCSAFRDEVARQVRAAEFSDLQGLIQGLSTGVQGELDKLDKREERPGRVATVGRPCGCRRGRRSWLGVRRCSPSSMPGWAGSERWAAGGGVGGVGGAGKTSVAVEYAHRQLAGIGVCAAVCRPRIRRDWPRQFGELAAQLGAGRDRGMRWRRRMRCWPGPSGWLLGFHRRAGPGVGGGILAAGGAGAGWWSRAVRVLAGPTGGPGPGAGPRGGGGVPGAWPAMRVGGARGSWRARGAGRRWRWSRRVRTCRPQVTAGQGTWGRFGSGGQSC